MRKSRAGLLVVLALSALAALLVPASASGFNFLQPKFKWPGHPAKIQYHNASKSQNQAVRKAAAIWNRSGIRVRFDRVASSRRADLKIVGKGNLPCGNGLAMPRLTSHDGVHFKPTSAKILLGSGGPPRRCRYIDVLTAAHEMGHVLGLDHEDKRCAVMNSSTTAVPSGGRAPWGVAPSACRRAKQNEWFCKVLTRDDLKGAKKLYGGHPRPRKPGYCRISGGKRLPAKAQPLTLPFEPRAMLP